MRKIPNMNKIIQYNLENFNYEYFKTENLKDPFDFQAQK